MRIGFFGTPQLSSQILAHCFFDSKIEIAFVVTQEDKAVGRKMILTPSPVKQFAQENNIPYFQPTSLRNNSALIESLKAFDVDYFVVVAYGKIFPRELLDVPKKACLNIHTSLLPKYRGSSPIQSALLSGDASTGITIMAMNELMDEGDVLATKEIFVHKEDTCDTLFELIGKQAGPFLVDTLDKLDNATICFTPQDHSQATYCRKIKKEDGFISFQQEKAQDIYNKWRAFQPWPGIFAFFEQKRFIVEFCDFCNESPLECAVGEVFCSSNEEKLQIGIKTKEGSLILKKVRLEGKSSLDIISFVNGYKEFIGYCFTS